MPDLTQSELTRLKQLSLEARKMILETATKGGCFVGSAFSAVDLILYLYEHILRGYPEDEDRDYFLLSKGHAIAALYSVLTLRGIIDRSWIKNHLSPLGNVYLHPNTNIRGIEALSGSLGHLPAISAGIALDIQNSSTNSRVFVLTGDGELNEGSVWETLLFASAKKLRNLTVIVDRNMLQANMPTEHLIPLEPLRDKFESFGLSVLSINGHDFNDMAYAFDLLPLDKERPNVIIAHTIRGKGLPSIENRIDRWFMKITPEESSELITEMQQYYAQEVFVS